MKTQKFIVEITSPEFDACVHVSEVISAIDKGLDYPDWKIEAEEYNEDIEIELEEFKQLVGTMLRYQKELHLQRLTNKRDGEKIQELTYHLREVTKKVESYLSED